MNWKYICRSQDHHATSNQRTLPAPTDWHVLSASRQLRHDTAERVSAQTSAVFTESEPCVHDMVAPWDLHKVL